MSLKSIEFGILSPKVIKEMSGVKIEQPELYDMDGFPIESGLADLRLGVVDPGLRCKTCGGSVGQCLGHFGHLELTKPVVNPLYGKKIYLILRAICRSCSRMLATPEEAASMKHPLVEVGKAKKNTCPHCGTKQKEISFVKPTSYKEGKDDMTSEQVRQRFENMTDDDVEALRIRGGRPEWLILTILPLPPVTVRPSITLETGERSEDDLTHKLVDVVRINERLKKNLELGAPDFIIADIWELLQYHISTYMDNEISTLPPARHRSGRALRTLIQRLGKKDGRFRGNLSGKRVNFSARTVISPDPCISMSEVGVPKDLAKELTVPIRVVAGNVNEVKKIVKNGRTWPGANYVMRPDGIRKKVTEENKNEISQELAEGYTVERHLRDGDIVLFNRQPSLHRMSMMGHRVRVMPYRTFRMNLTVTVPYNADFDGDEMNLHVPQTEEAQIETEQLAAVEKHIRSPRYGLPVICCKHDHITGAYLLTRSETRFDKKTAALLLASIGLEDKLDELSDKISGKELFSFILPPELNISYKSSFSACKCLTADECTHDSWVVIKDGKLKKGIIDEASLGEKKGKLINAVEKLGPEVARQFMDRVSRLAIESVSRYGFSISISEVDISERARKHIREILDECESKARHTIREFETGKISRLPGLTPRDVLETTIRRLGSEAGKRASEIIKGDLPFNNAVIMAKTGARGSYVNLTQMCAFVGQEALEGERIHRGYTDRTLSHFGRGDLGLTSRGFVGHNYKDGLDPFSMFFDAMNSRENLMDKSLHTRHSGYMERRLINALQDLKVEHDLTVRDSQGHIIQFIAGEDGTDPAKSDSGHVPLPAMK